MINKITLIGNLGKQPELKQTQSGQKVCSVSLATSDSYKDNQGEWQTNTEWHTLTLWDKQAEWFCSTCNKGNMVYVEGKIKYGYYISNDSIRRKIPTTEIIVNHFKLIRNATDQN